MKKQKKSQFSMEDLKMWYKMLSDMKARTDFYGADGLLNEIARVMADEHLARGDFNVKVKP